MDFIVFKIVKLLALTESTLTLVKSIASKSVMLSTTSPKIFWAVIAGKSNGCKASTSDLSNTKSFRSDVTIVSKLPFVKSIVSESSTVSRSASRLVIDRGVKSWITETSLNGFLKLIASFSKTSAVSAGFRIKLTTLLKLSVIIGVSFSFRIKLTTLLRLSEVFTKFEINLERSNTLLSLIELIESVKRLL